MITILGPTASGKTTLAVALARQCEGEIISADSRQVYAELDLGVGKDLEAYVTGGTKVPYHLIGHVSLSEEYNLFAFRRDFAFAKNDILFRGKTPILCGGTGLYVASVLENYALTEVPENPVFRRQASAMSHEDLVKMLSAFGPLHNDTDILDRNRLIRAIEIAQSTGLPGVDTVDRSDHKTSATAHVFGLSWSPDILRDRIRERLETRLKKGLLAEVQGLLDTGFSPERVDRLGLEYRYCLQHLDGRLSFAALTHQLGREICRYAKRQRTWFRRMEKHGVAIAWIPGEWSLDKQLAHILGCVSLGDG